MTDAARLAGSAQQMGGPRPVAAPAISRIQTAAVRIVGPSLLLKVWAGDTHGLGECYPSGPVRGIHDIVAALADSSSSARTPGTSSASSRSCGAGISSRVRRAER